MAKPKFFVKTKNLARITKIFAPLHDLAKRDLIEFRINIMLKTLILQGCIISEPVENAMVYQKIARVGTVFASSANQVLIAGNARKILATLQNLLDGDLESHKNWVKIKKLLYFIFFFAIIFLGIRKIQYGVVRQQLQLSRTMALPRVSCQCVFKYITYLI